MKMLLLSLVLPLTAFAHPGHQHADWVASLTHNPMVCVLSLLGVALLGAPLLAYLQRRKQALSLYGKFERRS
jgi:fumarate reductase subunit C